MNHIRPKVTPNFTACGCRVKSVKDPAFSADLVPPAADCTHCRGSGVLALSVRVDWLDVGEGEQVRGVLFTEEFNFGPEALAAGTGYVSRVAVPEADVRPGTFAAEAAGRRHYVVDAEAGRIDATGMPIGG